MPDSDSYNAGYRAGWADAMAMQPQQPQPPQSTPPQPVEPVPLPPTGP